MERFLCVNDLRYKLFKPYIQPEPMREIATIANLRHNLNLMYGYLEITFHGF